MALMAPDWLTTAMAPSLGSKIEKNVEKLATAPFEKLASPCVFGPTMRMPPARAAATMRRSLSRPSAETSPKPDVMQMAPLTPRRAQSSIASMAWSPATAMTTRSGTCGRLARSLKAVTPWTSGRPGLIG